MPRNGLLENLPYKASAGSPRIPMGIPAVGVSRGALLDDLFDDHALDLEWGRLVGERHRFLELVLVVRVDREERFPNLDASALLVVQVDPRAFVTRRAGGARDPVQFLVRDR